MTFPYSSHITLPDYPEDTRFVQVSSLNSANSAFSKASVTSLSRSIERNGFFEPIRIDSESHVIDGAKRLAASKLLSLSEVPVSLYVPRKTLFQSFIDSIQTQSDIFTVADILLFMTNELCFSRDAISESLSLGISAVSNKMRLASFSETERELFRAYHLCERHARTLLKIKNGARVAAIKHIGEKSLNVAQAEEYIDSLLKNTKLSSPIHQFEKSLCKLCDNSAANGVQSTVIRSETNNEIVFTVRLTK